MDVRTVLVRALQRKYTHTHTYMYKYIHKYICLFFCHFKDVIPLPSGLHCSDERLVNICPAAHPCIMCPLSLAAFRISSSSLFFRGLTIMWLGINFFIFILLALCSASWSTDWCFYQMGEISDHFSSSFFFSPLPHTLYSTSGMLLIRMLDSLVFSHKPVRV